MEKLLICDICGTSYADTEEKCPTCGYARAFEVETFYSERPVVPHVKVRGGRYSKKNVQKRLQELAENGLQQPDVQLVEDLEPVNLDDIAVEETGAEETPVVQIPNLDETVEEIREEPQEEPAEEPVQEEPVEEAQEEAEETVEEVQEEVVEEAFPADSILDTIEFPGEEESQEAPQEQEEAPVEASEEETETEDTAAEEETEILEEDIFEAPVEQKKKGNLWLNLALGFASVVFALSALYLVVTYAVPAVKEMLPVADPTVVATEAPTTEPTEAEEVLTLNYTTLTFSQPDETNKIFAVGIADQEIIWSTDDPDVASVDDVGMVTAKGPGTTTIHAVYGELEAVVTVTCDFE